MYDIQEWDGSVYTVRATFSSPGCVTITYCDGVTHTVSNEYFVGELRARPSRYQFHHADGCSCPRLED